MMQNVQRHVVCYNQKCACGQGAITDGQVSVKRQQHAVPIVILPKEHAMDTSAK